MGVYTITTLSERWMSWAIKNHDKCSGCRKQLGPDETVCIEDFDSDYASASCLDCAVENLQGNIEALQETIVTIKDIQLVIGRD